MTLEEAKQTFEELKNEGASNEEIAGALYIMFQRNEIDHDQLGLLVNLLGFNLSPNFEAMTPEEQKTMGFSNEEDKAMKMFGLKR